MNDIDRFLLKLEKLCIGGNASEAITKEDILQCLR